MVNMSLGSTRAGRVEAFLGGSPWSMVREGGVEGSSFSSNVGRIWMVGESGVAVWLRERERERVKN